MFSVPLSVKLPCPGVTRRTAHRRSDFPPLDPPLRGSLGQACLRRPKGLRLPALSWGLKASGYRRASPGGASRAAVVWLTATFNYRVPFTLQRSRFLVSCSRFSLQFFVHKEI
jgi:hypothetical protein